MEVYKITVGYLSAVYFISRGIDWRRLSNWERFFTILGFVGIALILADQYIQ